jgi:hypothetical protein
MKVAESFSHRKVELAHWLLEIEDEAILAQLEELRQASIESWQDQIPQDDLDAIDRSIADCKAGNGIPLEDYLKELEAL